MTPDFVTRLSELHSEIANDLLARVKSGEATAAELTAAIRFLKDNGIDANMTKGSPLESLAKTLPFEDPDAPIRSVG